ncbi:MAG: biopolymer transporter ExbD [Pseudomonadota bacterium]
MLTRARNIGFAACLMLPFGACVDPGGRDALERSSPVGETGSNVLSISEDDTIHWNGNSVSLEELPALLKTAAARDPEPELRFEPSAQSSYEVSVQVLRAIRESGVTKFGFVGNEKHTTPSNKTN